MHIDIFCGYSNMDSIQCWNSYQQTNRPTPCVKTEDISQICKQHALVCNCFEKIVPGTSRFRTLGHVWMVYVLMLIIANSQMVKCNMKNWLNCRPTVCFCRCSLDDWNRSVVIWSILEFSACAHYWLKRELCSSDMDIWWHMSSMLNEKILMSTLSGLSSLLWTAHVQWWCPFPFRNSKNMGRYLELKRTSIAKMHHKMEP